MFQLITQQQRAILQQILTQHTLSRKQHQLNHQHLNTQPFPIIIQQIQEQQELQQLELVHIRNRQLYTEMQHQQIIIQQIKKLITIKFYCSVEQH